MWTCFYDCFPYQNFPLLEGVRELWVWLTNGYSTCLVHRRASTNKRQFSFCLSTSHLRVGLKGFIKPGLCFLRPIYGICANPSVLPAAVHSYRSPAILSVCVSRRARTRSPSPLVWYKGLVAFNVFLLAVK